MKNLRNLLKKITVVTLLAAVLASNQVKTICPIHVNTSIITLGDGYYFEQYEF